jgi:hypothetical protein
VKARRWWLVSALMLTGFFSQASAGAEVHSSRSRGIVYFRPVLCFAPPYDAAVRPTATSTPSSCSATSQLNGPNLAVTPNDTQYGYSSQNVPPDSALASVPSTKANIEQASATVLLTGLSTPSNPSAERYLLGPAQMTSTAIARASAKRSQSGVWVVDYTLTKTGAALWDQVAKDNFHKLLGIDFDGVVVTAPLIQPSLSQYATFNGAGEISGNLTKSEATRFAQALQSGRR